MATSSGSASAREKDLARAGELVDAYLAYLKDVRGLSAHTVRAYATDLNSFLLWCEREGVAPLASSRRTMRAYLSYLVASDYAERSVNRRISALRSFFGWIERSGEGSAQAVATLKSRKRSKELPKTMTDDEMQRLIESCDASTPEGMRDRTLFELLYASGARISEAAGLKPSSIDFEQGQVRLFGKRSKERIVPLYDQALLSLAQYLREARPQLVAMRKAGAPADGLFVSSRGNNMSADALRRRFSEQKKVAGIKGDLTPHSVRHTFATELLSGGADLKAVQELLGHESLATTQIYTHLSIDRLKDATKQAHPRG